jgi:hypothetical protein
MRDPSTPYRDAAGSRVSRAADGLTADLAEVLTGHFGRPVTVSGLKRLAGSSSHETWAFDASVISIDEGHPRLEGVQPLILRREFSAGMPDTNARVESALTNCTIVPRTCGPL